MTWYTDGLIFDVPEAQVSYNIHFEMFCDIAVTAL